MKVLHIINSLAIGGAEIMLYRLLAQQQDGPFESSVISLMDRGPLRQQIKDLGVPVHSPGMTPILPSPKSLWKLNRIVNRLKPDLIHGWLYHSSLAGQIASIFSPGRIPVVWSIHSSLSSLHFHKRSTAAVVNLCARFSGQAAAIVFVSHNGQSQHRELGYSARNNFVIPNGIDIDLFVPSEESRVSVRSELGLPETTLLIGLINRYHPKKDHANFLRAAAILSSEHPDVHFLLAGRGVDENNSKLLGTVRELGLSSRTHLLGERRDISRLTAALDILSLSSLYGEGFPIIVGEAMACGVPCVVTDVGDSAWLVGDTGRIAQPGNPLELGAAWKDLIVMGPEKRRLLGNAARARVTTNFSLPSIVEQYETLFRSTILAASKTKATGKRVNELTDSA